MDDRQDAAVKRASSLTKVVREFAGSRLEKQIVAYAVDLAWQVTASRRAVLATAAAAGRGGSSSEGVTSLVEGAPA